MKTEYKTALHVAEGFLGYGLSEHIPTNILFKKWNPLVVGASATVLGFIMKDKNGGNHVLAIGLGATLNGILDAVGFAKY